MIQPPWTLPNKLACSGCISWEMVTREALTGLAGRELVIRRSHSSRGLAPYRARVIFINPYPRVVRRYPGCAGVRVHPVTHPRGCGAGPSLEVPRVWWLG